MALQVGKCSKHVCIRVISCQVLALGNTYIARYELMKGSIRSRSCLNLVICEKFALSKLKMREMRSGRSENRYSETAGTCRDQQL